jgi:HEAT repeat protein
VRIVASEAGRRALPASRFLLLGGGMNESTTHLQDRIPELIERLGHADRLERVHAAVQLVRLGRQGCRLAGPMTAALKDDRAVVRKMAALVLGDLAPEAWDAVPALAAALADADEGVRRRAAVALGQYGAAATEAIPALHVALHDPDEGVRSFAATALALIEPPSQRTQSA